MRLLCPSSSSVTIKLLAERAWFSLAEHLLKGCRSEGTTITGITNDKSKNKIREQAVKKEKPASKMSSKGELLVKLVSPRKILLTWDASELPKNIIAVFFQLSFADLVSIVRIYDVTDISFTGNNVHPFYEIAVPYQNGYWLVKGLAPNQTYIAELGVRIPGFGFFPFFRSNCLQTTEGDIPDRLDHSNRLLPNQRYEETYPKWLEHISTYSYYGEPGNLVEKHE